MSDFESFGGFDAVQQGMNAESFKEFQARMAQASQQIQDMRKREGTQKKSEDKLVALLLQFIRSGGNTQLIEAASKLLSINLPAAFIIGLLQIAAPDLGEKSGLKQLPDKPEADKTMLPDLYFKSKVLPLEIKIAIDNWLTNLHSIARDNEAKVLDHGLNLDKQLKKEVIDGGALCLLTFIEQKDIDLNFTKSRSFVEIALKAIFDDLLKNPTHLLN